MRIDYIDYNVIGGYHNGAFVPCVNSAAKSYSMFDKKHRAFLYEIMAVASDLGNNLINNTVNIRDFCSMEIFASRRLRPKPSDDEATLLHHLAIGIFSTDSKENDNNATVYGRLLQYFWKERIAAGEVIKYLEDNGGIYGVYEQVKMKYPGKGKQSGENATAPEGTNKSDDRLTQKITSPQETSASDRGKIDGDHINAENAALEIVEIEVNKRDLSRFLQLRKGEKLSTIIECVDLRGDWVVLKFTQIRGYPFIVETVRR